MRQCPNPPDIGKGCISGVRTKILSPFFQSLTARTKPCGRIVNGLTSADQSRTVFVPFKWQNSAMGKAEVKEILAIRCPTCGTKPGEKCELSTGQPRKTPHRNRRLSAEDASAQADPKSDRRQRNSLSEKVSAD